MESATSLSWGWAPAAATWRCWVSVIRSTVPHGASQMVAASPTNAVRSGRGGRSRTAYFSIAATRRRSAMEVTGGA